MSCSFSGTVDDTELIDGLVLPQHTTGSGGPNKVEKAKIGLIQFCISPPKTDVSGLFLKHLQVNSRREVSKPGDRQLQTR